MKNSQQPTIIFSTLLLALSLHAGALFGQSNRATNPMEANNIARYSSSNEEAAEGSNAISYVRGEDYAAFLNIVARYDDPYDLYNKKHVINQSIECHETDHGKQYVYVGPGSDLNYYSIAKVGWYNMARYCNWIENGTPVSINKEERRTTEEGAYTLNGRIRGGHPRMNSGSHYYVGAGEMVIF